MSPGRPSGSSPRYRSSEPAPSAAGAIAPAASTAPSTAVRRSIPNEPVRTDISHDSSPARTVVQVPCPSDSHHVRGRLVGRCCRPVAVSLSHPVPCSPPDGAELQPRPQAGHIKDAAGLSGPPRSASVDAIRAASRSSAATPALCASIPRRDRRDPGSSRRTWGLRPSPASTASRRRRWPWRPSRRSAPCSRPTGR